MSVECLSSLSETLDLLAELGDLENTIDDTYLPVEITYQQLTDFEVWQIRSKIKIAQFSILRSNFCLILFKYLNVCA